MNKPAMNPGTASEKRPQFRFDEDKGIALEFPLGIPGFEDLHNFHLYELLDYPRFAFLVADEERQVAMLLLDPQVLAQHDAIKIPGEKLTQVSLAKDDEICTFLVLRLNHQLGRLTANLRAPIVVSTRLRTGHQIILDDDSLPISYALMEDDTSGKVNANNENVRSIDVLKQSSPNASTGGR
ncbi:MAG TPA: hypothetical protein DHU63_11845 [Candidatus Marinimicrobia bacterium]|nr:MAG: hypothetical protein AUJ47_05470 [Candidatus Marinimicrobia bacterium CG1_02_48_14]PIZ67108.1 MAG: hypothetical protein COY19_05885 [Candidatus Marinimicrobia bacterium CG_4_10_14_0_2_um_filter_48_9]PJA51656.1 MAG: hypothetical protein CO167_12865 [Candidatus Marinimicrobia bacterium CG_4_9_14_3_um_filter_48_9]HCW77214.1 hypothetical protein [Candidatus Neomarinimicrobiota bacterium]